MYKNRFAYLILNFVSGVALFLGLGVTTFCCRMCFADTWLAPEQQKHVSNPIAQDESSISAGKRIYTKRCEGCHGSAGSGDGPDAADLSIEPAKLYDESTVAQADGELFWKIRTGKKPMPKYDNRLSEEETWHVINFIRTLGKK